VEDLEVEKAEAEKAEKVEAVEAVRSETSCGRSDELSNFELFLKILFHRHTRTDCFHQIQIVGKQ
jgi:hypothetical protein